LSSEPELSAARAGNFSSTEEISCSEEERSSSEEENFFSEAQLFTSEAHLSASEAQRRGSKCLFDPFGRVVRELAGGESVCLQGKTVNPRRRLEYICKLCYFFGVRASDLAPRERTGALSAASQGRVRV
jgi:hypothetical protein